MFSLDLSGDKALEARLKALPATLEKKALRQALRQAFKPVLAEARAETPADTGRLRKSLKLRALKTKRRGRLGVVIATGTRAELGIPADAKYYYPAAVELGIRKRQGTSFLRGPLHRNRERIANDLRRLLEQSIETVVAKELLRLSK